MTDFVLQNRLFTERDRIGVALSGGADSVALASLMKRLGYDIVALHLEHGIRDEESVRDMRLVEELCKQLQIPLEIKRVSVPNMMKKGESVESAARRLRYAFFEEATKKFGLKYVAVAHHIEDASETFIFNLLRGSGLKGLSSMRPKRAPNIVRPLLFATRSEIEEYLDAEGLKYADDSTNEDINYTRNYLRKVVLPTFKKINPSYDQALMRASEIIAKDDDALEMYAKRAYDELSVKKDGEVILDIKGLKELHEAVAKRTIRMACAEAFSLKDVDYSHIEAIYELVSNAKTGKKFELKGKFFAEISYNSLKISSKDYIINKCREIPINLMGETHLWKDAKVVCEGLSKIPEERKISPGDLEQIVNGDALKGAVVRKRRSGDAFCPFGSGNKKLKDWLIDKKVPRDLRDEIPIIAVESDVLWVVGQAISEKLRVDENTRNPVRIKFIDEAEET